MRRKRLLLIFGTRPEVIKLAPLVFEASTMHQEIEVSLCATGQHDQLLQQACAVFGIEPKHWLGVMMPNQSLHHLTSRLFEVLPDVIADERPDWVIVQGDTTSAFVGAMCAFYQKVMVAHVEAGLRTDDPYAPFPEEINRRLISHIAYYHFAPTQQARANLLAEGVAAERIFVTGNTVVDAVQHILAQRPTVPDEITELTQREYILATLHRRESFGEPLERVVKALLELLHRRPALHLVLPVHPNPNVRQVVETLLGGESRVHLSPPVDYPAFVALMAHAALIVTDSGGVQEEATALGKWLLITRDVTERPEVLESGRAELVGTSPARLLAAAERCLNAPREAPTSVPHRNPFGDGHAARRILTTLRGH